MTIDDKTFGLFLAQYKRKLQNISRHTRGEESLESVQSEAWMMIHEFESTGVAIDLDKPEDCSKVIGYVYQKLVRYTDTRVRYAVRLDHAASGEDEDAVHPLMRRLAADEQYEPLVALTHLEAEVQRSKEDLANPNRSLAGAYLDLLSRFGNRMSGVATHLMISLSYCYRRVAHARVLATFQQGLPAACVRADAAFVPGPWRHFRMLRAPEQLCLDFGEHEALFSANDES